MKNSLIRIIAIVLGLFSLVSCDKDFNSIGSDVLGDDHFDLEKYEVQNLVAYTKPTGAVQSNNLPVNGLGIYENPAFGTTTAHFVTQLELTRTYNEPEKIIGENFTFNSTDSVYLYVPYFATDTKVVDENTKLKIYELDSIYGDLNTTFDLKIYENGYYLNDFSAAEDFQNSQKHYTDEANKFDSNVGAQLNTSSDIYQNTSFKFNSNEIVLYKSKLLDNGTYVYVDEDGETLSSQSDITVRIIKERMNPGMWINLDKNILKLSKKNMERVETLMNKGVLVIDMKNYLRATNKYIEKMVLNLNPKEKTSLEDKVKMFFKDYEELVKIMVREDKKLVEKEDRIKKSFD